MHGHPPIEKKRSDAPTTWHLCWQSAAGREIFVHPSLYERVRARLLDAHGRPGRVLVDYLLLPKEIHVVCEIPQGDTAGRLARAIGNVVARWVGQRQGVRSPVFASRFRAYPIGSIADVRNELRMLAWRPVLAGLCRTPIHHPHGGLRIAFGLTAARGFDPRPMLCQFGEPVQHARSVMRVSIGERPSVRDVHEWELSRGLVLATGSMGPQQTMAREVRGATAQLVAAGGPDGIDGALRLLEAWISAKIGSQGICEDGKESNSTNVRGRALVACLAVKSGLCSAASVARFYGRAKSTLSEQMAACRSRPADRQILATPLQRIVGEALDLRAGKSRHQGS